nr:MAG TPA: PsbA, PsbB, PsbC, PsbD, PsbE-FCP supercomplex, PLANT PROTEIN [Caudoviricetes sp.]
MTVEQFLKSLSDLMWSCFWGVVVYNFLKKKK